MNVKDFLSSWLRTGPKSLVGVDIGSSSIKVVELKRSSGNGYELEALGVDPIPPDAIMDGVIVSKPAVAEAIDKLFDSHNISNDQVAIFVSGHSVIVKTVRLPAQNEQELDEAIKWEAEQYIPFDISEVNLDYQVVRSMPEEKKIEVLLVAAKRDQITGHTEVISMVGQNACSRRRRCICASKCLRDQLPAGSGNDRRFAEHRFSNHEHQHC